MIYVRHEQLADSLVEGSANGALDRELRSEFQSAGITLGQESDEASSADLDSKSQDRLWLGFGECFSSKLVTAASCRLGSKARRTYDARNCIVTDARHGQANPVWEVTEPATAARP